MALRTSIGASLSMHLTRPDGLFLRPFSVLGGCLAALALASCSPDETTPPPAPVADPWFVEMTSESGVDFTYQTGARGDLHMPEIMGAGVAVLDYDNDGDLDLYFTNGNDALPDASRDSSWTNALYRQENGTFVEVAREAGVDDPGYGMGVAVGDIDNDGHLDLFVANYGPDRLFRNRGDGTFEDVTDTAGIDVPGWSVSTAMLDYDRDGFLDIYITQYVDFDAAKACFDRAGRPDYCGPKSFPPVSDVLLRNRGDGTFEDVSARAGMTSVAGAGLGVVCEDMNNDGWIDVYVANDAYANQLWINQGDGTFRDVATELGAAYNMHGQPEAGMGVLAADLDNDRRFDLFMTHLGVETNTYYRNLGADMGFEDATGESGLGASSMAFTGFGTCAFDADLDGDLELAVANGRVVRGEPRSDNALPAPWDRFSEPNLFYVNDGAGAFTLAGPEVEALCANVEITRGMAMGDLDNDGDLDLVITNLESPARLYRNEIPRSGRWLIVRAVDPRLNRDALGARLVIEVDGRSLSRTISGGDSYVSSSDLRAHFGLGKATAVDGLEVRWPDGLRERFDVPELDRAIVIERGTGTPIS